MRPQLIIVKDLNVMAVPSRSPVSDCVSSSPPQVDLTKCVVNTDPSFHSHWLVAAVCAFGHYLKATVLHLLREK